MTNTYRTWEQLSRAEQLYSEYSDFYKEVNGFRPRLAPEHQTVENLERLLDDLANSTKREHDEAMKTFAGRCRLREEGWVIPDEIDPTLARYQAWIKEEEERERAAWYADVAADNDAQFYGEMV